MTTNNVKQFLPGIHVTVDELVQLRFAAARLKGISTKKIATPYLGGHLSRRRGRGIDFSEVRAYQNGDDTRTMDWRVTARTGEPHTKLYAEEREQPWYVLVDLSPSMFFGTRVAFKSVIAAKAAALVAWTAVQCGERIGALIIVGDQLIELPARSRQQGVLSLLKVLSESSFRATPVISAEASFATSTVFCQALSRLRRITKGGSALFVLSDFNHFDEQTELQFIQLTQYTDCRVGFIYDPLEASPPPPNRYAISNGDKTLTMNTTIPQFCKNYREQFQNKQEYLSQTMKKYRVPLIELPTNKPVTAILPAWEQGRA